MVQRVSVRRARIEEQRARKQILIAGAITAVVGVIFLFVIFPLMLRGVIYVAQRNAPPAEDVVPLPPQAPVIAAPPKYSNTGDLEISGYTSPNVQVKLIVNEQERASAKSNGEGTFEMELDLEEGEFTLYLFAEGDNKNTSPDSTRYQLVVDRTKPQLEVENPENGKTFSLRRDQNQTARGQLSEPGYVLINSSRIRTNSEGEFQAQIALDEGENTFTFIGEDLAGNQSSTQEVKVTYNQ